MSDYVARWLLLAVCLSAEAAVMSVLGIGFDLASARPMVELLAILVFLAIVLGVLAATWGRPVAVASDLCFSFVQMVAAMMVLVPLSYLAALSGAPLRDGELAAADAALGFHWDAAAAWVAAHPALDRVLQAAYFGLFAQTCAVLAIGSVSRPGERNSEAVRLFIAGALFTVAVFAFTPALGKVGHLGPRQIEILTRIRSGGWTELTYAEFAGIVNFPSFHTTLAILWTWTVRRSRWLLAFFVPLNLATIAATPTVGGHYLVDLPGGAVVAAASILVVRSLRTRRPAGTAPVAASLLRRTGPSPG